MSPIGRIVAQLVVAGVNVTAKAFMQAYQQAVVQAKNSGGAKKAAQNMSEAFSKKIKKDDAKLILNLTEDNMKRSTVEAQFQRLFDMNAVEKGGSFYLQSKIYRAKERLLEDLEEGPAAVEGKEPEEGEDEHKDKTDEKK